MAGTDHCRIREEQNEIVLENRRFRVRLALGGQGSGAGATPPFRLDVSRRGNGNYDIETGLRLWTGFAGITSHIHDFFLTTDDSALPSAALTRRTESGCAATYGPLYAAGWEVYWDFELGEETLAIESRIRVTRRTMTDSEVDVLAFDVPESDEFTTATFNTGYVLPPKDWFRQDSPEITYAGNDGFRSPLDRRTRLRFNGEGHETLTLHFRQGYGLNVTCDGPNYFLLVPKFIERKRPKDPKCLPSRPYRFRSHERFGIGTAQKQEGRRYVLGERLGGRIVLSYAKPEKLETLAYSGPDRRIARLTSDLHRTHGHSCIGHDSGFSGGWHNAGGARSWSVSFEYFMHSKIHLYSADPRIDALMDRSLDSVMDRETQPNGLAWSHGFEGRGGFLEANASMLIYLGDYVRRTGDLKHAAKGRVWADWMLRQFTAKPFLFRAPNSTGIPGDGTGAKICNWWDVIRFGGHDAYANVLGYAGLAAQAEIEAACGNKVESERFRKAADRQKEDFNKVFWMPEEGRYAAWVDANGHIHDYHFTPVNLMAVHYGLCDAERGRKVLDGIERGLRQIGYKGFSLPCNLISFPPEVYDAGDHWFDQNGYRHFYDPFGVYENGGIWTWLSGYYGAAWRDHDPDRAFRHFAAILDQYERDNLQGMGNGYFWDPETGEMQEGSRQEPYLSNAGMCLWGFLCLLGIEMEIPSRIRLAPRIPKAMAGSELAFRYHGRAVRFRFDGWGERVAAVTIDGVAHPADRPIEAAALRDGGVVEVKVTRA